MIFAMDQWHGIWFRLFLPWIILSWCSMLCDIGAWEIEQCISDMLCDLGDWEIN
jgi:hypothetical protein